MPGEGGLSHSSSFWGLEEAERFSHRYVASVSPTALLSHPSPIRLCSRLVLWTRHPEAGVGSQPRGRDSFPGTLAVGRVQHRSDANKASVSSALWASLPCAGTLGERLAWGEPGAPEQMVPTSAEKLIGLEVSEVIRTTQTKAGRDCGPGLWHPLYRASPRVQSP